ncbi:MAG TPA: glycosyltransferase family 1 protein [Vicinamibacterales bacterium]|jgi:alpha-1,3-rhamnosyl/mannosyltransferase
MHIGLNLLHPYPAMGGIWHYIARLLDAGAEPPVGHLSTAFVTTSSRALVPPSPRIRVEDLRIPGLSRSVRVLYENLVLDRQLKAHGCDLVHWFAANLGLVGTVPAVVSVYDLREYDRPGSFSLGKRLYLKMMHRHVASAARHLLPISSTTAGQLALRFGVPDDRMTVIPPIVSDIYFDVDRQEAESYRQRRGLPGHFWLYVSDFRPYKNHAALVDAYAELTRRCRAWPLALRGEGALGMTETLARARQLGVADRVRILDPVPENEMPYLYATASALVFPSLYEGSGMPLLEAQAVGCPILSSSIAALRESAGDAAVWMDADDASSIAAGMERFQADGDRREACAGLGRRRAERWRAPVVANLLWQAYAKAARAAAGPDPRRGVAS